MAYDLGIYRGLLDWRAVNRWVRKVDEMDESDVRKIVAAVPDEWSSANTRHDIMDQLISRRQILPQLLHEAEYVVKSGYSLEYHRARNATEPGQLCHTPLFTAHQ